jgi:hypothetical protein
LHLHKRNWKQKIHKKNENKKIKNWLSRGFLYRLIWRLGLLSHYRVSFVRDVLFHF